MNPNAALARSGKKLRQIREEKRLSTAALAALSGVSEDAIKQFEAGTGGEVLLADLLVLADVLGTDIRFILSSADNY